MYIYIYIYILRFWSVFAAIFAFFVFSLYVQHVNRQSVRWKHRPDAILTLAAEPPSNRRLIGGSSFPPLSYFIAYSLGQDFCFELAKNLSELILALQNSLQIFRLTSSTLARM